MPTNTILAAATTDASQEFTVAAGGALDLYLTADTGTEQIPQTAEILIQKKSGSNYVTHFRLNREQPSVKLSGAGTWRAKRKPQDAAVGLDSET